MTGNDIYGTHTVTREVYAVRAVVRSGNSGGPLVGDDGTVWGMVFATALDSTDTGYVLTDDEVGGDATAGRACRRSGGDGQLRARLIMSRPDVSAASPSAPVRR